MPATPTAPELKLEPRIYSLHVQLERIEPLIWRRILVEGTTTLAKLHRILQLTMGWTNSHLHSFRVGHDTYSNPAFELDEALDEVRDERKVRLHSLIPHEGFQFIYEYDFGDSWHHLIRVESIHSPDSRLSYPLCVAGARACPPEDVGGSYGYADFLAAIQDAEHEEHDGMIEWCGGVFDVEGFDLNAVNYVLHSRRRLR